MTTVLTNVVIVLTIVLTNVSLVLTTVLTTDGIVLTTLLTNVVLIDNYPYKKIPFTNNVTQTYAVLLTTGR